MASCAGWLASAIACIRIPASPPLDGFGADEGLECQIEHARSVEEHLRTKSTNEDLYGWMEGRSGSCTSSAIRAYGCGVLEVPGCGKKKGEVVHLDPERRSFINRCLAPGGHLSELEEAYNHGQIKEYYIFQKGRLSRGPDSARMASPKPGPNRTLVIGGTTCLPA